MQVKPDKEIKRRSRFYQAAMDMKQLGRGKKYETLKDTYIIFICLDDPFDKNLSVYTVDRVCKENNKVDVENGTHEIYLNASAWQTEKNLDLKAILIYIKSKKATTDLTKEIDDAIEELKTREEFQNMYVGVGSMHDIATKEGYDKGVEYGIQKGYAKATAQSEKIISEKDICISEMSARIAELEKQVQKMNI